MTTRDNFDGTMAFLEYVRNCLGINLNFNAMQIALYRKLVKPGWSVVDIGAHSGVHTRVFLNLVGSTGRVMSFEPNPFLNDKILADMGDVENLTLRREALSNEVGNAEFWVLPDFPEESGLRLRSNRADATKKEKIEVQVECLDNIVTNGTAVDLIKIDVEGAEMPLLEGARQVILKARPILFVEYGHTAFEVYGSKFDDLNEWARLNQYDIFDLFGNRLSELDRWHSIPQGLIWDYVLVPSEKVDDTLSDIFEPLPNR
ncbi:FkbM family methyltransferase [Pseudooctadecabacter jejudonensis]|uniref:2-O-methyltransferase NoeI n=1 Tax=Pseudooctadecabacter jejudonensis TaxID=1391910 RepID=A0A1Y5TJY6_9RHOB|nr:FkbM family methyltransferase [Pseudooctadecabacter jejudonensis]SLN62178.1 2-O-methyltransferase NoeI [Pseudooctadecabacter jejudonensis]